MTPKTVVKTRLVFPNGKTQDLDERLEHHEGDRLELPEGEFVVFDRYWRGETYFLFLVKAQ